MKADYGVGWRRAQLAAQGVGFEPTPHLDGDGYTKFVQQTMDLALKRHEDVSEDFITGVSEGAVAAWERHVQKENDNDCRYKAVG